MTRARWLVLVVVLALLAPFAWTMLQPAPLPYESINAPPRDAPARPRVRADAGAADKAGVPTAGDAGAAAAAGDAGAAAAAGDAGPLADMVDLVDLVPGLRVDLRYARADSFLGRAVYPSGARALLRRDAAERLARVQARLAAEGLGLLVWDAYRPLGVQRQMWALVPDERYVADPARGGRHNRGMAVDVTLVDREGRPLPMPTAHDDFSPRAAADAPADATAAANRARLRRAMEAEGFTIMPSEWWHFDAPGWEAAPAVDAPLPTR